MLEHSTNHEVRLIEAVRDRDVHRVRTSVELAGFKVVQFLLRRKRWFKRWRCGVIRCKRQLRVVTPFGDHKVNLDRVTGTNIPLKGRVAALAVDREGVANHTVLGIHWARFHFRFCGLGVRDFRFSIVLARFFAGTIAVVAFVFVLLALVFWTFSRLVVGFGVFRIALAVLLAFLRFVVLMSLVRLTVVGLVFLGVSVFVVLVLQVLHVVFLDVHLGIVGLVVVGRRRVTRHCGTLLKNQCAASYYGKADDAREVRAICHRNVLLKMKNNM